MISKNPFKSMKKDEELMEWFDLQMLGKAKNSRVRLLRK
jgi:hypothetical protein